MNALSRFRAAPAAYAPRAAALLLLPLFLGMAPPKSPAKNFEKAAKQNNVAAMLAAAEEIAAKPDKAGVKVLVKFGPFIESFDVYAGSRDALASCTSGEAREELVKALYGSKKPEQRVLCADALGDAADTSAVEVLGKAIDDKDKTVRIAIIRALQRSEKKAAIQPLYVRLDKVGYNSGEAEAEEIYGALHHLTGQAFTTRVDWDKYLETLPPNFDPKKRVRAGNEATTRVREGQGKIFDSVVRSQAFVIVLDISGSMRVIDLKPGETWTDKKGKSHKWKDPDPTGRKKAHPESRFARAQDALVEFIGGLNERARFALVMLGAKKDTKVWKPQPVSATKANKKQAIDFVKKQRYSSATRTDLALDVAFQIEGVDSIYLYTDGKPQERRGGGVKDIPTDSVLETARTLNRTRKIKINCYNLNVSDKKLSNFLIQLAEENDGEFKTIHTNMQNP